MSEQPKAPARGRWHQAGVWSGRRVYCHASGLVVLSELSDIEIDGMGIITAQWVVSVSSPHDRRPINSEMGMVRRDFDMREAEEDNHEPGIARKLWLIVDPELRRQHAVCACKADETLHVEPDGFRWSEIHREAK